MPVKFYKKFSPGTAVVIGNQPYPFSSNDRMVGYFATEEQHVQDAFAQFMREQRYGLTEIGQDEFEAEYVQKKRQSTSLPPKWREEMQGTSVRSKGLDPVALVGGEKAAAVLGVKVNDAPRGGPLAIEVPPSEPSPVKAPKKEFAPPTGRRNKK